MTVPSLSSQRPPAAARSIPGTASVGEIPRIAVDQYAATLSKWYGMSDTDRALVFPNLGRFSSPNLGFMV